MQSQNIEAIRNSLHLLNNQAGEIISQNKTILVQNDVILAQNQAILAQNQAILAQNASILILNQNLLSHVRLVTDEIIVLLQPIEQRSAELHLQPIIQIELEASEKLSQQAFTSNKQPSRVTALLNPEVSLKESSANRIAFWKKRFENLACQK